MGDIVFSHRGALGDFVLAWPALSRLRTLYPGRTILGLGRPGHMELARTLGLADAWLDAESSVLLPFYAGDSIPPPLRGMRAALLWTYEDPRLRALLAGLPGPATLHPPFPQDGTHVLEHNLRALGEPGPPSPGPPEALFPSLGLKRENLLLIHPGSGSEKKNFPPELYGGLARDLPRSGPFRARGAGPPEIRIVLGPAEEGAREFFRARFPVEEPADVVALARLVARASLFVGNDSGPSHLAAALGTPTIALFRSTDPAVWGVRGTRARSLRVADESAARKAVWNAAEAMVA